MYGGGYGAGYGGGYGGGYNPAMGGGMGMNPNIAQGMGMAMGNPYAYRSMNWQGYQMMGSYNIPAHWIETQGPMIFMMYDRNQSGTLEMFEVPQVMNYIFQQLGLGYPNMQDVYFCMHSFDSNHDGRLNLFEFKRMLHFLAGRSM